MTNTTYRSLQITLQSSNYSSLCTVKLNSKRHVLEAEIARINEINDLSEGYYVLNGSDSVVPETVEIHGDEITVDQAIEDINFLTAMAADCQAEREGYNYCPISHRETFINMKMIDRENEALHHGFAFCLITEYAEYPNVECIWLQGTEPNSDIDISTIIDKLYVESNTTIVETPTNVLLLEGGVELPVQLPTNLENDLCEDNVELLKVSEETIVFESVETLSISPLLSILFLIFIFIFALSSPVVTILAFVSVLFIIDSILTSTNTEVETVILQT